MKSKLIWFLIIVNLLGFLFGIYYYIPQLSRTPVWLWLFVIDCPLFVLLFALILLFDIKNYFFNFFVSVGVFKYGIWTVFVILLMWEQFLALNSIMYPLLAISHFFMAFEFIFLIPRMKVSKWNFLTVPIFIFMDNADYLWNLHPWLPSTTQIDLITQVAFTSSSIIPVLITIPIALYQWRLKVVWGSESLPTRRRESVMSAKRKKTSGKLLKQKKRKFSVSVKNARKKVP
jgi:uncharacterized membrane protein YpjA